ncbi:MAG: formyltransferase family protein, partial [Candidatus Roizmanbacteria bacterium]
MENPQLAIGFLASHNGTDAQAIVGQIEAGKLNARAGTLISNNSREGAALFAKDPIHNMNFHHVSSITHENPDAAMAEILLQEGVELVICSGFMKPIGPILLATYPNNIWNPHPADTR